jgi:hypothetical protein
MATLLNELRTEDEKAFYNYTRLPRGLYDGVLRRVEGRIEMKDTKTFFASKRRCWACKSYSSCSLRGIRRSNAVAFIFLVVSSSKYAILQELNCDYGSYTRLCSVELLRTD